MFSIAILWLAWITHPLYPQERKLKNSSTEANQEKTESVSTPDQHRPSDETVALRAQLEVMREYDQRLLNTVNITLQIIIASLVAIFTVNWIMNVRVYRRDINNIKKDSQEFSQRAESALLKQLNLSISSGLENIKKEADKRTSELSRDTHTIMENLSNHLDGLERRLKDRIYSLEYRVIALEANRLEYEGLYVDALALYLKKLLLAKDMQWDQEILSALNDIARVVKVRIDSSETGDITGKPAISVRISNEILDVLDDLPPIYSEVSQKVYHLLDVPREAPRVPLLSRLDRPPYKHSSISRSELEDDENG